MKKNKRDLLVLSHLRQNARKTLTQIGRQTRIPISTLHEVVKAHRNWKYTVLTDFAQLGFLTKAHIYFKVKKDQKQAFQNTLKSSFHVNSLYKVNNGFDFMAEVVFRHLRDLEQFLELVEDEFCIKNKEIHHIMEDLKREEFLAQPNMLSAITAPLPRK